MKEGLYIKIIHKCLHSMSCLGVCVCVCATKWLFYERLNKRALLLCALCRGPALQEAREHGALVLGTRYSAGAPRGPIDL